MPSPAAFIYRKIASRGVTILKPDRRSLGRDEIQALYGASFVASVAAWNAYIPALIKCFYSTVAIPSDRKFNAIHKIAEAAGIAQLDRFNTPNSENSRNLITNCTGYDPWPDWQWQARNLNALDTRARINEILKVRHSFAHGFSMPGYSWTQSKTGEVRLTIDALQFTRSLFSHLVTATDKGMKLHIHNMYGIVVGW